MTHPAELDCDLLVIGGGINGTGIARDAAGRGLSVILCEQDDLGAHTSSASSKLIHGGLRYLQHYEFGLVRKALREREVLLRAAPHLIRPLRFIMPHVPGLRPAWMLRCGLFLYDHLARRELLEGSRRIDLRRHPAGAPLDGGATQAFVYSDAAVDDARLVVLNALDAAERGARILTRTRCHALAPGGQGRFWRATLHPAGGPPIHATARCVVNAAGAWAMQTLSGVHGPQRRALRLVKGSHIVVRKLFEHDQAYIFQHRDGRIVFAIPYEGEFTLIGTTDIDFTGDPREVRISGEEVDYLCALSNDYFRTRIAAADVVWSYAGVRPLVDDGAGAAQSVTRDYELLASTAPAPMLSVFGGKITTYRTLAEQALERIAGMIDVPGPAWTAHACLPGGDIFGPAPNARSVSGFAGFIARMQKRYPWLPPELAARYARAYGTRMHALLAGCGAMPDLGPAFTPQLHERELRYLVDTEWARSADDVLWRRTKLGLRTSPAQADRIEQWMRRAVMTARLQAGRSRP